MTVTFLFTDMEGSTVRWVEHPQAMGECVARHDALLREAFAGHGGRVFTAAGDGFAVAFDDTHSAVAAAIEAQAALVSEDWSAIGGLSVRMGIHEGQAEERGGDYFGSDPALAARIMAVGHGGQILLSDVAARRLDTGALVDLGEHRLKDFPERRRLFQAGSGRTFPPLRSLDRIASTLPAVGSALVGRQADLQRTRTLMAEHRLVTLVGSGGVGKTRLAIEAASREQAYLPDGTFFIDLTKLSDPDDLAVFVAVGLSLALESGAGTLDQLASFLRDKRALLLLDNCEHVLDGVAELVDDLLPRTSDLRLLATSREPIDVDAERVFRVPPLAAEPAGDGPSPQVQLFLARLDDDRDGEAPRPDVGLVAEICERLDGIPLAIELAAARARVLSLEQLRDGLDDRFALLGGRTRRRARQRTLEATLDWSYGLLGADEQRWFRTLSVFHAPFTLEAAAAVLELPGAATVDAIDSLVAKSLLNVSVDESGHRRFRMLETMQAYAQTKLLDAGDTAQARNGHATYFASQLPTSGFLAWGSRRNLDRIDADYADLVGAAQWAADRMDEPLLVRLIGSLNTYWAGARPTPTGRRLGDTLLGSSLSPALEGFVCATRMFQAMIDVDIETWMQVGDRASAIEYDDPPPPWSVWARMMAIYYRLLIDSDDLVAKLDDLVAESAQTSEPDEAEMFVRLLRTQALIMMGRLTDAADDIRALQRWLDRQDEAPVMIADAVRRNTIAVALLQGRANEALAMTHAEPLYPESFWASEHSVLCAIAHGLAGDTPAAAERIVDCARRYGSSGLAGLDSLLLVGAAVVRHEAGQASRCLDILDVTAGGRAPSVQAIAEKYYAPRFEGAADALASFRLRAIDPAWSETTAASRERILREELEWLAVHAGEREGSVGR